MTATMPPVAFAGKPARANDADESTKELAEIARAIVAGEEGLTLTNGLTRARGELEKVIPLVIAGAASALETGANFRAAKIFLEAFGAYSRYYRKAGSAARVSAAFAHVARHIAAGGEFAPQAWDDEALRSLGSALWYAPIAVRQEFVPTIMAFVRAHRDTDDQRVRVATERLAQVALERGCGDQALAESLVEQLPALAASLEAPWSTSRRSCGVLTESIAKAAFARLSADTSPAAQQAKRTILGNCSLAWLTPEAVDDQISSGECSPTRFNEFEGATPAQTMLMLDALLSAVYGNFNDVRELRGFAAMAADPQAVMGLFGRGYFWADEDRPWAVYTRNNALRCIADAQKSPKVGRDMLHAAFRASFEEMKACEEPYRKAWMASCLADCAIGLIGRKTTYDPSGGAFSVTADPRFLASLFRDVDLRAVYAAGRPDGAACTRWHGEDDAHVRKSMERADVEPNVALQFRAALIECGAIDLGSIRRKDLTAELVGSALKRRPARLAEVTNLTDFVRLAKALNIPVSLPEGDGAAKAARTAAAMRKAMGTTSAISDALPEVDPVRRPAPRPA